MDGFLKRYRGVVNKNQRGDRFLLEWNKVNCLICSLNSVLRLNWIRGARRNNLASVNLSNGEKNHHSIFFFDSILLVPPKYLSTFINRFVDKTFMTKFSTRPREFFYIKFTARFNYSKLLAKRNPSKFHREFSRKRA